MDQLLTNGQVAEMFQISKPLNQSNAGRQELEPGRTGGRHE